MTELNITQILNVLIGRSKIQFLGDDQLFTMLGSYLDPKRGVVIYLKNSNSQLWESWREADYWYHQQLALGSPDWIRADKLKKKISFFQSIKDSSNPTKYDALAIKLFKTQEPRMAKAYYNYHKWDKEHSDLNSHVIVKLSTLIEKTGYDKDKVFTIIGRLQKSAQEKEGIQLPAFVTVFDPDPNNPNQTRVSLALLFPKVAVEVIYLLMEGEEFENLAN